VKRRESRNGSNTDLAPSSFLSGLAPNRLQPVLHLDCGRDIEALCCGRPVVVSDVEKRHTRTGLAALNGLAGANTWDAYFDRYIPEFNHEMLKGPAKSQWKHSNV
jgi:hypothetical protein